MAAIYWSYLSVRGMVFVTKLTKMVVILPFNTDICELEWIKKAANTLAACD
ncbi:MULTISPECIES: hypothetical protein [Vibrio]|uniref:hypothetical protein n=1 Tax=Vibrio TaxID=662 RepID=UPI001482D89C|nr:hypothetical protein [Vibrio genomosp. F6]